MVVVLVAEPCATHSQGSFLCAWALTDTPYPRRLKRGPGSRPANSVARPGSLLLRNTFGRFPALRTLLWFSPSVSLSLSQERETGRGEKGSCPGS